MNFIPTTIWPNQHDLQALYWPVILVRLVTGRQQQGRAWTAILSTPLRFVPGHGAAIDPYIEILATLQAGKYIAPIGWEPVVRTHDECHDFVA